MGKEKGYKNLELGRGWNKGKGRTVTCAVCNKTFPRSQSSSKSKNSFCSIECKAKGMSLGLCSPIRLGTGCDTLTVYLKRKFYKYRQWDKKNQVPLPDFTVWQLVERLRKSKCYYCRSKENLGLDKINNNNGHTSTNTVVSCELCNMTRGARFTVEEMKEIGKAIKKIRERR